jgi:hypothetical protein
MGRLFSATVLAFMLSNPALALAGPPYFTDDPEPVGYRHWEFYLATQHEVTRDGRTGTLPHVEVNYGPLPALQLHVLVPLAYATTTGGQSHHGPGDVELGAKVRFIDQDGGLPMIGTFPMLELPTGAQDKGLGTGHVHGFIPVWVQERADPWLTYGGVGYWINPGQGNRNYWAAGWLVQRSLTDVVALGSELFYTTADHVEGRGNLRVNLGLVADFTVHHHLLASAGTSIAGDSRLLGYLAYQLTI